MPINASVTEYHRMQIDFLKAEKSQVLFFSKNLPTSAHNSSLWSKDLESFPFFGVSTVVGGCVFVAENFFSIGLLLLREENEDTFSSLLFYLVEESLSCLLFYPAVFPFMHTSVIKSQPST